MTPPSMDSDNRAKQQFVAELYTTAAVPLQDSRDMLKRQSDPEPYSVQPAPPLGGADRLKRQYNAPSTYQTAAVPTLEFRDNPKRQYGDPPTYEPAPAPPLGGDKMKRQLPTYAAAPAPPLGDKVKRQYPTYATAPPPPLGGGRVKRQLSTYAPAPAPPLGGGRVKRQLQTYAIAPAPSLGDKVKRQPPTYSSAPAPPLGGGRMKRQFGEPSTYTLAPAPPLGADAKVKRQVATTQVSTTATQASTSTSTSSKSPYTQLAGTIEKPKGLSFPADIITTANYNEICPGGNCLAACQNMTRVFEGIPDGINAGEDYGKPHSNGSLPDVTLFGVCSNLGYVSTLAQTNYTNTSFASFFPPTSLQGALHNVSNDISLCLVDTCQYTRDPSQCRNVCSLNALQTSNTSISVATGVYPCLWQLCRNTCGLPYANQDVYGAGVLASYITQGILVLLLAIGLISFASWRYLKQHSNKTPIIPRRMKESMELFLATECYFGISAAIASYLLRPATVDPLNGYALLSVAITGFIPTTFTLMLLHSHGVKSWYTSLLTFASWIFSTVLFFMLLMNLTNTIDDPRAMDQGLNSLFHVDSCGHSSAMSLCKQTFSTDPIAFLSYFYNYHHIPGIKTVPILWVLSTVVLLCLAGIQGYEHIRGQTHSHLINSEESQNHQHQRLNATLGLTALWIGSILFGLALGYQARMVVAFTQMDVINWHGWTFGQVVALLFWAPALINCFRSYVLEPKQQRHKNGVYESKYSGLPNEKAGIAVSTEQLSSLTPMSQKQFFSPSDASIYRQESEWSEQGVRVPMNMLLGNFGQRNRSGREEGGPDWVDSSKRDSIIR